MKKKIDITVGVRSTYDCGLVEEDVIRKRYDKDGNCYFEKVGTIKVQDNINSFKNGCALSSILERCKYMPIIDKVQYLAQTPDAVGADLVGMPKDLTEAFVLVNKEFKANPKIFERFRNGESFDSIVKDILKFEEKEIANDGTDKSSD